MVIDATFNRRAERDAMRDLAAGLAVPCRLVECVAPHGVLAERIRRRQAGGRDASDADLHVLALLSRHREPLGDDETALARRLDTDLDMQTLRERVRALSW